MKTPLPLSLTSGASGQSATRTLTEKKDKETLKMIILQSETAEHRTAWTSAPQGEPYVPPTVLTPQSPCTATRAVGVGTLYRDTIYAAAGRQSRDRDGCKSSQQMKYSPVHTAGGSSLPSGWERILGQGHFHPPTCAGATIRAQKVDDSRTIYLDKIFTGRFGTSLPMGHLEKASAIPC